ncbi:MAG: MCE family protein [Phycisphaeraceae bacterium]|nr:MAG: MCE family protein [Phycisphaeraceae bacterium]
MSRRTENRNNVLAGLFLVSALILAVFLSFWVEEGFDKLPFVNPRANYNVRFTLAEGVAGLKPGSPVTLGGKEIGSITSIEYATRKVQGRDEPTGVNVTIRVESAILLHDDASVKVVKPLLGSLSSLDIFDVGGGEGSMVLAGGGSLDAEPQSGIAKLDELMSETRAALKRATDLIEKADARIDPFMASAQSTVDNVRDFADLLRANEDLWVTKANSILDGAEGMFRQTLPGVADEVAAGVGDARRLMATAQDVVDENRADIRRTVSNVEGLTTRARYDVLGRVERVLDESVLAAANASTMTSRLLASLDRIEPPLNRSIANFQLASGQAVLLLEELRAAPWRAIKEPSEKQQREVVIYSAVRRYAEAVERLRDASGSLESVLNGARAEGRDIAPDQVRQMTDEIKRSFGAYTEAEQDLLSLIARQTGEGK